MGFTKIFIYVKSPLPSKLEVDTGQLAVIWIHLPADPGAEVLHPQPVAGPHRRPVLAHPRGPSGEDYS